MEQIMKCGKVIDSQGKHIHVKFCPICSKEDEVKKNVSLDIINDSEIKTKTENLEAVNDSKSDFEDTKTDNLETDSDSMSDIEDVNTETLETGSDYRSEDEESSWGIKVLGTILLGIGLFVGLLYLAYKWATHKIEHEETDIDTKLEEYLG